MRKYLTLLFLLLICIFYDYAYAAQPLTDLNLQVEGNAPILKNDIARAREEAVKSALEKAIMQAASKILSAKYEDEKFQAVKSIMISKTDRYVKNYRMISENRMQDEYIASVNVVVALASVRDDLLQMGILKNQGEKDNILVFLSLKGVKKYSDFSGMKTFLQSRPKIVKSIYPCRLDRQQAHFDLVLVGDVQTFVTELEKTERYFLETLEKNQDVVDITLQIKEEVR